MARKLNPEEKIAFQSMVEGSEAAGNGLGTVTVKGLTERSQAAMRLTPELAAWFALEFPLREPDA